MSLAPPHLPSPVATPDTMPPPANPPLAVGTQADIRYQVERRLLSLTQDLYELEICAGDVVPGQEDRIPAFMMSIDEQLIALNDLASRMTDSVPHQVIENVDQYRNPHSYTKNALSRATGENQYSLGRILGLESFRRQLQDALTVEFPSIPLPERRHRPIVPQTVEDTTESDVTSIRPQETIKEEVDGPLDSGPKIENGSQAQLNGDGQPPAST